MRYANLDLDYFDHPKTRRLVGFLGKGSAELPLRLWCYCGKYHCDDGRLTDYSTEAVESAMGWWGEKGKGVEGMLKCGFLEQTTDGYVVHDWSTHQGHFKALRERGEAGAEARWAKYRREANELRKSSNAASNAKAMLEQCSNLTVPSNPTSPPHRTRKKHLTPEQSGTAREVNGASQSSIVECFFESGELPKTEKAFIELMREMDAGGMANFGGLWRNRWREDPEKCLKLLATLRDDSKDKIIGNPGGYMGDLWGRFP